MSASPQFKIVDVYGDTQDNVLYKFVKTYIIYYEYNEHTVLMSLPSWFVKSKSIASMDTSRRYANIIKNFFQWYSSQHNIKNCFWQNVSLTDIHEWQIHRVIDRDKRGSTSPNNKTILDDAMLIAEMFNWFHDNGYYSQVKISKKKVILNFKDQDMLAYIREQTVKEILDSSIVQVVSKKSYLEDRDFVLMNKQNLERFMEGFFDIVYVCIFYLILCTGLRISEVVQVPYKGKGPLKHIRFFKEMSYEERNSDIFRLLVLGKGKKQRKPVVPTRDWAFLCELYEDELYKRRKLYKAKYHKECPDESLWLTSTGDPVSREQITDAFKYNSKKTGILISPHDGRAWFATTFVAKTLGNRLDTATGYHLATDEKLRIQLGHSQIKTTYVHYLKLAKLYKHIDAGFTTDLFTDNNTMLSEFTHKDDKPISKTNKKTNKLLIIRGLPGSGKSYLAKLLSGYVHYETDMYFITNGKYFYDPNKLQRAHEWCQDQVKENLQAGNNVVVSNTFITLQSLKPYFEMGYEFDVLTPSGEFENEHNISKHEIYEMKKNWQDYEKTVII